MNVLMVGVDEKRIGGMWAVAETFLRDEEFNRKVNLRYVATSTCGSCVKRLLKMITGYVRIFFTLLFGKIDFVHVHMAEKGSVYRKGAVVYLAKMFGAMTVVQMHAGPIMTWYAQLPEKRKKMVRRLFSAPDRMLVLGEYWKKQMAEIVPEGKIEILYNGADCPAQNPYNVNGKNIVFMGMLKKEKGVIDLIDAIDKISDQLPADTKVYLCGSAGDNSIQEYIQELDCRDRFILTGWIDREKQEEIYADTQMSVLPSYAEALSMTVIESMCRGIPMITTRISTMPELLGDGIEMIAPGDTDALARLILKLSRDKELRKRMSESEYARVKDRFSTRSVIDATLDIYARLRAEGL